MKLVHTISWFSVILIEALEAIVPLCVPHQFWGALKIKIKIWYPSPRTNRIQYATITSKHPMLTAAIRGGGIFFFLHLRD